MLQFQLPQFHPGFVLAIGGFVGFVISVAVEKLMLKKIDEYRKRVRGISKKVEVDKKELDEATTELKSESIDLMNSLMILRYDIERELRRLAKLSRTEIAEPYPYPIRKFVTALKQRDILSPEIAYAALFVYNFCSRAIHGEVVSEEEAIPIRELGIKTLINLRKLVSNLEQRPSTTPNRDGGKREGI